MRGMAGTSQLLDPFGSHFMHRFTYRPWDYTTESGVLAGPAGHRLWVMQCVQLTGGRALVSDLPPEPFSVCVAGLPAPPAFPKQGQPSTTVMGLPITGVCPSG